MSATAQEIEAFRSAVERAARVIRWGPSTLELYAIAAGIANGDATTRPMLERLIATTVPGTSFDLREGVDVSDLKTLLALARKLNADIGG